MSEKIQINLNEVKELFLFLEDLNQFFHSPSNYGDQQQLIAYVEGGMYDKLRRLYYHTVLDWLPPSARKEFEDRPSPFDEINSHS